MYWRPATALTVRSGRSNFGMPLEPLPDDVGDIAARGARRVRAAEPISATSRPPGSTVLTGRARGSAAGGQGDASATCRREEIDADERHALVAAEAIGRDRSRAAADRAPRWARTRTRRPSARGACRPRRPSTTSPRRGRSLARLQAHAGVRRGRGHEPARELQPAAALPRRVAAATKRLTGPSARAGRTNGLDRSLAFRASKETRAR